MAGTVIWRISERVWWGFWLDSRGMATELGPAEYSTTLVRALTGGLGWLV
jgi:hypothetical protein